MSTEPCSVRASGGARSCRAEKESNGAERRAARHVLLRDLSAIAALGDLLMVFLGFLFAFWLRFQSGFIPSAAGAHSPASLLSYWNLITLGTVTSFFGLLSVDIYREADLLHVERIKGRLFNVLLVGLFLLLGFSLIAKTSPSISRTFVLCAFGFVLCALYGWRFFLNCICHHPALARRLRQRLMFVGWTPQACRVCEGGLRDFPASIDCLGCIQTENLPERGSSCGSRALGGISNLAAVLERHGVDVLVVVDENMKPSELARVVSLCEREQVEFKKVPQAFEVFVSALRPSMVGDLPVLALEGLPLNLFLNRLLKRVVDVTGALVGLLLSLPLVIICGTLVRWESRGPVFYRQVRMGLNGRLFRMIKLRSMRPDAEK